MSPKDQIAATYNAASDRYDAFPLWRYYGEATATRARLSPGEIVLDVCSGTGSSAIPAARAVAPAGRVIALDIATAPIALARSKAAAQGLANVEFRHADFDQAYFRSASFDAVLCNFGLFFFPDMPATLKKMWRLLRPGGRLTIATWAEGLFEPAHTAFWTAIHQIRPDLDKISHTRARLCTADQIRALFEAAAIPGLTIEREDRDYPLASPDEWWTLAQGASYRATIDRLTPEEREQVRAAWLAHPAPAIQASVLYATAG